MDFLIRNRWTGWIMLFLIVLNLFSVGMLIFIGLKKISPPPHPREGGANVMDFLIHELALSDDQMDELLLIQADHREDRQKAERYLLDTRRSLLLEAIKESPDSSRIAQLSTRIGETQETLDLMVVGHLKEIRTILNTEQDSAFMRLMKEVLRRPVDTDRLQAGPGGPEDRPRPHSQNDREKGRPLPTGR